MISDLGSTECYVYIVLPGKSDFVTAGRFQLECNSSGIPVGRFVYGKSYLSNPDAVSIDPIGLKLGESIFSITSLKGVFGALRDAGPDYWGRHIVEKYSGIPQLGEIDYLLNSMDDSAGALNFGRNKSPPAPRRKFNETLDLKKLITISEAIIADEFVPQGAETRQVRDLNLIGTSMGGARPKAVIEDVDGLWLAKFTRPDDQWNHVRIENAMLKLAKVCEIKPAQSKVIKVAGRDVLLIKRFDRERTEQGYLRHRMMSGLTVLRTEDSHLSRDRWSYVILAEELNRICTRPKADLVELFKRMVFNALISNTDDHPRNHAVIAKNLHWELSPAYDLTPSKLISQDRRDLALICGDFGRYANAQNMLSQCYRFNLEKEEAASIINTMEDQVKNQWYKIARREEVSEKDCEMLSNAFAYQGFRYTPEFPKI